MMVICITAMNVKQIVQIAFPDVNIMKTVIKIILSHLAYLLTSFWRVVVVERVIYEPSFESRWKK
jgi:uncharacterized membrane protein